ncbi:hypothetical protein EVAR_70005_1 [Eumeta japonica]|uniref:Uncharacterized protein n=1 Tax=Eumeta variegata TaxID=151549 RepID=A0A4C2AER8_EUMVA|nr:hypothetical protein EVAR_70005_1 [Eumeta japonica]
MSVPWAYCAAGVLGGALVVAGGNTESVSRLFSTKSVELYDLAEGQWRAGPALPENRAYAGAARNTCPAVSARRSEDVPAASAGTSVTRDVTSPASAMARRTSLDNVLAPAPVTLLSIDEYEYIETVVALPARTDGWIQHSRNLKFTAYNTNDKILSLPEHDTRLEFVPYDLEGRHFEHHPLTNASGELPPSQRVLTSRGRLLIYRAHAPTSYL